MKKNSIHLLILCAGRGTRLHPLTKTIPKPLLSLGESTILERLIHQCLFSFNVDSIWINVSHLGQKVCSQVAKIECNILNVLWEPKVLGSASTLFEISKRVDGNILVIHGDLVLSNSYVDNLSQHVTTAEMSFIVCHIRESKNARSVVRVSKDGKVKSLRENVQSYGAHPVISNSGVYYFIANENLSFIKEPDIVNSQIQNLTSNNLLRSAVIQNPRVSVDSHDALEQAMVLAKSDKLRRQP